MKESFEILKDVIDKVGSKEVAFRLKVSPSLIYKWCEKPVQEDSCQKLSGATNPLDRVRMIFESTRSPEIIYWICQMADGFFVSNPKKSDRNPKIEMLLITQKILKEFSETLNAIVMSYEDQEISASEAQKIRKEWEDLKRITEGFVHACEQGHYLKKT